MAQPHKGDRKEFKTRVPELAANKLEEMAKAAGCKSVSQYLSDVVCQMTGHPELVRELNQEVLPISA